MTDAEHEKLCLEHRHALRARVADRLETDPWSDETRWLADLLDRVEGRRPWGPPRIVGHANTETSLPVATSARYHEQEHTILPEPTAWHAAPAPARSP